MTILSQAILPGNGELTLAASPQELSAYEVWAIDQSNSLDGTLLGGNLYILSGNDKDFIKGTAKIEQINLGTNAFEEGFEPGKKPHWTAFNNGATHLIVGHASSGHVYAIDADKHQVVDVVAPGQNSHAISIAPDNKFVLVADTPGEQIHKIPTNYEASPGNLFGTVQTLKFDDSTRRALGTSAARPVVAKIDDTGMWAYVTFGEGGVAIIDLHRMAVAHVYSSTEVTFNGLVGLQMGNYFLTNAGNADPAVPDFIYVYDHAALLQNPYIRPAVTAIAQPGNDIHDLGIIGGNYIWQLDRASNTITVNDFGWRSPVNSINLVSTELGSDPTPDMFDMSPSGEVVFFSQRGPTPLSANDPQFYNSVGIDPGVGVVKVKKHGKDGKPVHLYRFDNFVNGNNIADVHAVSVRK